jgi:hypothetical protein
MAILGESFKPWVIKQINVRQDKLSARNKDTDLLKYLTSRTSFLRLTSGVDVSEDLLTYYKDYLPEGFVTNVKGNELARQYVLEAARFRPPGNTINDPLQFTSGVGYNNTNRSSYGFLSDPNYGLVPPPGITTANIKSLNRGTIREATIQIVCHNLYQLIIINILFLKLKYSLLLEWGHTVYYDNNGELKQDYDIPNLSPSFLDGEYDQISLLKTIAIQRQLSNGNYDAFFGLVKNFEWQAEENGSYTITISALSTGDVIESLKINTDFNPNKSSQQGISFDKSTLHKIIGKTKSLIGSSRYIHGFNDGTSPNRLNTLAFTALSGILNGKYNYRDYNDNDEIITNGTGSSMLVDKEGFRAAFPSLQTTQTKYGKSISSDQYYIKLGTFFRLMEAFALFYDNKKVIITEDNQRLGSPPMFFLDHDFDKHECLTLPSQVSANPTVALIPLVEPTQKEAITQDQYAVYRYSVSGWQGQKKYTTDPQNPNSIIEDPEWVRQGRNQTRIQVSENNPTPTSDRYTTLEEAWRDLGFTTPTQQSINFAWIDRNDAQVGTEWIQGKQNQTAITNMYSAWDKADKTNNGSFLPWTTWVDLAKRIVPPLNPAYPSTTDVQRGSIEDFGSQPANLTPIIKRRKLKKVTTTVESGNAGTLQDISLSFRTNDKFIGKTMHIYVNIQHIINVLDDTIEDDGSVPLLPFLNRLLSDIGTALGSINKFDIDYDDETNTFSVIDSAIVPLKYSREFGNSVAKFNINALNPDGLGGKDKNILGAGGSFITNFSLKSEIFSSIGNAIALGAQKDGNQPGSNSSGISKINEGIIDRIMTEKTNNIVTISPYSSSFNDETTKSLFEDYIFKLKSTEPGAGLTPEDIDFYKSYVVDVYQHELGFLTNNTGTDSIPGAGFIPLNLQLTMDGLSGLIQYQTFEISENVLPPEYYNKLRFITTTIEHKISADKGWETTISTLGVPRSKTDIGGITNEGQPLIELNTEVKVSETIDSSVDDAEVSILDENPTAPTPPVDQSNETKPGTTKPYIIVGDSGSPTIQLLTKARLLSESDKIFGKKYLWESGKDAKWVISALKPFSPSPDVKVVVVMVGTNDGFIPDASIAKTFMNLLKEKFPNAKYVFVQGAWGFGKYYSNDPVFGKPEEPAQVKKFYKNYKDLGAIVVDPPIGYSTTHPGPKTPTYSIIAEEINRIIALNK